MKSLKGVTTFSLSSKLQTEHMNILVLNCGSSSLKFQIIQTDLEMIEKNADKQLAKGLIERIGSQALVSLQATGKTAVKHAAPLRDHRAALDHVIKWIISKDAQIPDIQSLADIHAVGHRVVHGAEQFTKSTIITDAVIRGIEDCIDLAPLHNPANLKGIHAARELLGAGIPAVVVFDTSFHSTMPETSFLYAIPYQLYRRHKIRRYGFHGTSHRYVAYRYRQLTGKTREETNVITIHLGNGCSACAIKNGASFDTSMGLSPLEGLVMGTRGGDIDPAVLEFLSHKEGMSMSEIDTLLNKQSGLLGISGLTNDMRDLLEEAKDHQDRRATLAINIFAQRAKKYIGSYLAELNGADALIFTGGIGENAATIRQRICANLEWFGIEIDEQLNNEKVGGKEGEINTQKSRVKVFVIPTNEELLIARDTVRCIVDVPKKS
jgi:acetate kinase